MATKPLTFTTDKRDAKPIPFELDGEEYTFTPHKIAGMMLPVIDPEAAGVNGDGAAQTVGQRQWDWFRKGLGDDQYGRIIARLKDPDDDLDYPDVTKMSNALMRAASGRPTKRR